MEYIGRIKENKIYISKSHAFDENSKAELTLIANIEPYKIAKFHRRNFVEQSKYLDALMNTTFYKKDKNDCQKQVVIDFGSTKTMLAIILENGEVSYIKTNDGKI